jgi:hypothetical protein
MMAGASSQGRQFSRATLLPPSVETAWAGRRGGGDVDQSTIGGVVHAAGTER